MQTLIYADHAATTALTSAVCAAMQPWLQDKYGNPSTLYSFAREPRKAVASARETIAACIGARPEEIYFTSGGTEADNWALIGTAFWEPDRCVHIITSSIEHHAILHTCDFLKCLGYDVDFLPVNQHGLISAETLDNYLRSEMPFTFLYMSSISIPELTAIARNS